MDSEEDYGFSDEDMDDDEDVGAENMYYNSKGMLEEGETAEGEGPPGGAWCCV